MRYSVFFKKANGEKTCVYNTTSPDLMLALMNPKVHLAADSAGTFSCSLNPSSPAMSEDILERMATKVMIEEYKDHVPNEYVTNPTTEAEEAEHIANGEKVIFYGRLLSIEKDFYNTPSLYCEGAWSFLNDTVIMPWVMPKKNGDDTYFTPAQAIQKLLQEHNTAVGHQANVCLKFETDISKMIVTMKDDLFSGEKNDGSGEEIDNFRITTYTNTLEVFNNLKKTYGGHFRVRYRKATPADAATYGPQMAIPIVDWIADCNNSEEGDPLSDSDTYIKFGKNLLDLTQKTDGANIVNCLFLTGKKIASADAEVIGDEIDVAPMCYYWMVKDNGEGVNGTLVTSNQNADETSTNRHDLRFFTDVIEGRGYRNPRDLTELAAIGETDMSHLYHIGTHWYAYNPYESTFVDIKEIKEQTVDTLTDGNTGEISYYRCGVITEDDLFNGNVTRMTGLVSGTTAPGTDSTFIDPSWTASSRGMAWGWSTAINRVGGNEEIRYESWRVPGGRWCTDYSATGVWDSENAGAQPGEGDRPVGTLAGSSLEVWGDESYYYKNSGFSVTGFSLVLNITSKLTLRKNGCVVISSSSASSGVGTDHSYSKMTIQKPQVDDQPIYLNMSSKTKNNVPTYDGQGGTTTEGSGYYQPSTRDQINMQLWRTRKTDKDEYVTLYGIADGENRWFLDTEKYLENGVQKSRTVLRIPKRVSQLLIGTTDDERWFVYPPKDSSWSEFAYESSSAFPDVNDILTEFPDDKYWTDAEHHTGLKVFFIAKDNGYIWKLSDDNTLYEGISPLVARAYKVNSYGVEDPISIAKYGRIEKIVNFSNCSDPATLRDLGAKKLFEAKLEGLEINVTALDLSLLENNVESPDVLDMIKIQSTPHHVGIEDPNDPSEKPLSLPLSERDIPLNDPSQQQYTIGYTGTRKITRTYDWVRK